MKTDKFNLRLSKQEKELLKKIVDKNGITITEYIRQKLFSNNTDISDDTVYECPQANKRDYLIARTLQNIYMLQLNMLCDTKSDEQVLKIKEDCRNFAEQNIAKLGFLKIEKINNNRNGNNESGNGKRN